MKIALLGYGIEGESAYHYYKKQFPDAKFTVYDEAPQPKKPLPEGVQFLGNRADFRDISADIIVRTPSVSPHRISSQGEITSLTKEFFKKCPAPIIIGVTGTKGKGTTSSLIYEMLTAAGTTAHLVGNIGVPALSELSKIHKDDIVVYEMSSFQLWDMTQSPHTAVVLMIEPDHLNVHDDFSDYVSAKANIARWQTTSDTVIYHPTNQYSQKIAAESRGQKLKYNMNETAHTINDQIWMRNTLICDVADVALPGPHNLENICAAVTAVWRYTQDVPAIKQAIHAFHGLSHRLQFVAQKEGVKYYDDSIATTPGSAIAALRSFEASKILILGGQSKGASYEEVIIAARDTYSRIIAIGETKEEINALCQTYAVECCVEAGDMSAIVNRAHQIAHPGDIVILSPASSSFDMFTGYQDRGDQFARAVHQLAD
jgi:UDP-N-acetylmuramoylalanine--D-glutamate ligase